MVLLLQMVACLETGLVVGPEGEPPDEVADPVPGEPLPDNTEPDDADPNPEDDEDLSGKDPSDKDPDPKPEAIEATLAPVTAGPAPLAVFFDGIDAPELPVPGTPIADHGYADWQYIWAFGDPASGDWATVGGSRDAARGIVAAHVYDTPGTYEARLTVIQDDGTEHHFRQTIEVSDPDAVFAGSQTICVSGAGVFADCPTGAQQLHESDLDEVIPLLADDTRILFRRGETFAGNGRFGAPYSNVVMAAFGPCVAPDERGICGNAPVLSVSGADQAYIGMNYAWNWRVHDLSLEGPWERGGFFGGAIEQGRLLWFRVQARGFSVPLGNSFHATLGHDQIFVVDADLADAEINGLYIGSERLVVLGTRVADPSVSHVLRVWQAYKGVLSSNVLSGASQDTDAGRLALKLHGPREELIADEVLRHRTSFVQVSGNIFGGSGPWPVSIMPQSAGVDERLRNIVVEGNRWLSDYGNLSCCSSRVQVSLLVTARGVTVRNNVFSGEGSARGYRGILVHTEGAPVPDNVRIWNNTIVKVEEHPGEYSTFLGIDIREATNVTVQNNLIAQPSTTDTRGIEGVIDVEGGNVIAADLGLRDPAAADPLDRDFTLVASSVGIDKGVAVPVFVDLQGEPRPQGGGYDAGATEQ